MFVFVGVFNLLTFRLSAPPYNLSTEHIGLLFLTYLSGTLSSAMLGVLSGPRGVLFSALAGLFLALAGLFITLLQSIWFILIGLLVYCFGFFAVHSSVTSWVSAAAKGDKAASSGLYVLFYYAGASLSGVALSPIWDSWGWAGVILVTVALHLACIFIIAGIKKNA
jgi:hypothetical protein